LPRLGAPVASKMAVEVNGKAAAAAEAEQIARLAAACRKASSDEDDDADNRAFQDCEGEEEEQHEADPGADSTDDVFLKLPVIEPAPPEVEDEKPHVDPPGLVLAKKDWDAYLETMRVLVGDAAIADEDKVEKIHDVIVARVEDTRGLDEDKTVATRRLEDAGKDRDRIRSEMQRVVAAKAKLEGDCREFQQQKSTISKENKRIAEEEQSRHNELREKFEQAIKDVQEKMDAELEVRQHFLKENEELRGKLQKFTETYEAQEEQLAQQRETRGREMETAQTRLQEHETMCKQSKVNSAMLEKENETLRKSEKVLRAELQSILGKFDDFHEAITGSNTRHSDCKTEIDTLQTQLQELEKENTDLRNNETLNKLLKEQEVAQKQRDALDKLCDGMERERRELHETLRKLKGN